MGRLKDTITLSVPPGTKERLEQLAEAHGLKWGTKPSPSALVGAIADGTLALGGAFRLNEGQLGALDQAVRALTDNGCFEEARTLVTLMLDHGQVDAPMRAKLMQALGPMGEPHRVALDALINNKQPFYLHYVDVHGKAREFSVHHAHIGFRDRRSYLYIWAEETEGNQDLPGLNHNWVLRLDRAKELLALPGGTGWREEMDSVQAEMKLVGRLAKDYEARPEDSDERFEDDPDRPDQQIRYFKRKVYSSFWFLREVLAFGQDAEVLGPPELRARVAKAFRDAASRYEPNA